MPEIVRDRDELLLNAIATGDATDIDPRDREEKFLKAIAENIGNASKVIYRHNVICRFTIGGTSTTIIFDILNHDATPITSITGMIDNFSNIVEYHLSAGGPISYLFWGFEKIAKVSGTGIRLTTRHITQDADTKIVSSATENSDMTQVVHDDVIAV